MIYSTNAKSPEKVANITMSGRKNLMINGWEEIRLMDKADFPHIEWQEGNGESVEIGYLNANGQQCCGHCGVPGTDHGQYAYKTECTYCGYVYGTNGTDMHERKCPECQKGAPGIRFWRIIEK